MSTQSLPELHPAAAILPAMTDDEYVALRDSIRDHGQQEACVMVNQTLLDGRHRWRACIELGLEPKTREYAGECDSPVSYTLALNVHRRHLTVSQRAILALEILPIFEAEAKQRQQEQIKNLAKTRWAKGQRAATQEKPRPRERSSDLAGRAMGVGRATVDQAKCVQVHAPDLLERVKRGEMPVNSALLEVRRRKERQNSQLLEQTLGSDLEAANLLLAYRHAMSSIQERLLSLMPEKVAQVMQVEDIIQFRDMRLSIPWWLDTLAGALGDEQ